MSHDRSPLAVAEIVQHHPDLLFVVALDGTILEYLGRPDADLYAPADEFLGRTIHDVLPVTVAARIADGLRRVGDTSGPVVVEYTLPVSGDERTFEARLIPLGTDVLAICRDVTEWRPSGPLDDDQPLRQIADAIDQVVWLVDAETGRVLYVNPAFESIWGRPVEELYANPHLCHDAILETYRPRMVALHDGWLRGNPTAPLTVSYPIVRPDGAIRWVLNTSTPVRRKDGTLVRLTGVAKDITAQRHAEVTRRRLEAELVQAQRMETIGTLAAGMAHAINNALTVIIGNAQLARAASADDRALLDGSLTAVIDASSRAQTVVGEILTFGRHYAAELRPMSLGPLVEAAAADLRQMLPPLVQLAIQIAPDAPTVLADASQVQKVVDNLVTNAAQAMAGHEGLIEIAVERFDASPALAQAEPDMVVGPYAKLVVRDNGPGMDETTRRRLFEPFFSTNPLANLGLGLSVVHGVMKRHGGTIRVWSQPGFGSRFELYFQARDMPIGAEHV